LYRFPSCSSTREKGKGKEMKRDPDIHDTDARDFELFLKGGEPVKEEEEDEEAIFQNQERRARLKEDISSRR